MGQVGGFRCRHPQAHLTQCAGSDKRLARASIDDQGVACLTREIAVEADRASRPVASKSRGGTRSCPTLRGERAHANARPAGSVAIPVGRASDALAITACEEDPAAESPSP